MFFSPQILKNLEHILKYHLVLCLLAFYCMGIIFSGQLLIFLIINFSILLLALWGYFKLKQSGFLLLISLVIFSLFGFFQTKIRYHHFARLQPNSAVTKITGSIINEPETAPGSTKFILKTQQGQKILVSLNNPNISVTYGDQLSLSGRFQAARPPTNPGQFDYPQYLFFKGINGLFYANQASLIHKSWANPFKSIAYYLQAKVLAINRKTLPQPYADLYTGLVFGDQATSLPEEITTNFRKTGLTHLLVVSGAQVALLSGIMLAICSTLQLPLRQSFVVITIINIIFFFISGGGASIFRAIMMNEIVLFLRIFKRNSFFGHIFGLTALIMLIINPFSLFDIGAQLSFLATFALVFGVPKLATLLPEKIPALFKNSFGMVLAPFIFTSPILWYYFHSISPISLISNLLVLNLIELLVIVGFFSTVLGFFILPLTQIINNFSLLVMILLNKLVAFLADFPLSSINLKSPHWLIILLIYGLILLGMTCFTVRFKALRKYFWLGLASLIFYSCLQISLPNHNLIVTFLDIGQGDSILIQTPGQKTLIIDAGPLKKNRNGQEFNSGQRIVQPALAYYGVNRLDAVITSHFHDDHFGGIPYLLSHNKANLVLDNGHYGTNKALYTAYQTSISKKHLSIVKLSTNATINLEKNLTLQVLYPFPNQAFEENENNNSIVLLLTYKQMKFLFTSDIEEPVESQLVATYGKLLHADILKVGHHGSKTSSSPAFLQAVQPRLAVISVGAHNMYGHPSKPVVARLMHQAKVFRTDQNGAIEFTTNGHQLFYKTYLIKKQTMFK